MGIPQENHVTVAHRIQTQCQADVTHRKCRSSHTEPQRYTLKYKVSVWTSHSLNPEYWSLNVAS